MMQLRRAALVVTVCLCGIEAGAQAPPELNRQQRTLLQALITAVDGAAAAPVADQHDWLLHVLRASDGSHYVAFSITPPVGALGDKPIMLYVRLGAAARAGVVTVAERSVVREWLAGSRIDPRLLPRRGGLAIGDMPAMGANVTRDGRSSVGSPDLQAMNLERDRARQRREAAERQRRAELEGLATGASDHFPFEDFDVVPAAAFRDGTRAVQRALTAGPGTYHLLVSWADASQPAGRAEVHVARHTLQLAPVAPEFGLSTIIVADGFGVRAAPYSSLEQRAHPYAIGVTEITPARDTIFTPADRLSVAFQIVNPMPSPTGKPDVRVNLRIVRLAGAREEQVATLSPLLYDDATMPPDFDLRVGHPIIAALSAPLATIPRGEYRLVITAEDRLSSNVVAGGTTFTVVGTPESLLAEAPPLGPRFDARIAVQPGILSAVLDRLTPGIASAPLNGAIQSARSGRFADLLVAETVPAAEQGARVALTGLALLSLSNPSSMAEFQRALDLRAPEAPVQLLLGASRAQQGRDAEAIAAWDAARQAGFPTAVTDRLIAEALLRQKDYPRAARTIGSEPPPDDGPGRRTFAATRIAVGRHGDAIRVLDALLAQDAADLETRWLLLHALYAQFVGGDRGSVDRVRAEAQRYIDAKGPHAALAGEWLRVAQR